MRGNILIDIPGELRSSAVDNIVVSADGVHDYTKNKSQELINEEQRRKNEYIQDSMYRLDEHVNDTASQLQNRMYDLEQDLTNKMDGVESDIGDVKSNIDNILSTAEDAKITANKAIDRADDAIDYIDQREDVIRLDVEHQFDDLRLETDSTFVASASYNSSSKKIEFTNANSTIVALIDASAFIKDGMISSAAVSNGQLVITFNTDAGKDAIRIPVTDIFNANNYYNKVQTDSKIDMVRQVAENAASTIDDYAEQIANIRKTVEDGNLFLNDKITSESTRAIAAEQANAQSFANERQNRIDADSALDTKITAETTRSKEVDERHDNRLDTLEAAMIPATVTTLGLVKLYNQNGTNRSGLSVNEDGSLLINASSEYGLSRSGDGKLVANIRRSATTDDINKLGATDAPNVAAVTISNFNEVAAKAGLQYKNDATLTIQKEGKSVGTFATNATTNSTINIVETDPTVPAWAKAANKPTYTAAEVGALASGSDANYFDNVVYDSKNHKIVFKHGNTEKKTIDASDFIKDGMVNNVEVKDNNLVITFNTDADKQDIKIPISNIFNANNYYTKDLINGKFYFSTDKDEDSGSTNYLFNTYNEKGVETVISLFSVASTAPTAKPDNSDLIGLDFLKNYTYSKTESDDKYNPIISVSKNNLEQGTSSMIAGDEIIIGVQFGFDSNNRLTDIDVTRDNFPGVYTSLNTDDEGVTYLGTLYDSMSANWGYDIPVITTTKTEHEIEIYADKECTTRPTGVVTEVYVKLNRDFGYGDFVSYDTSSNDSICVNCPDSVDLCLFLIYYCTDFSSSEQWEPFKRGDVIKCTSSGIDVTNASKSYGKIIYTDDELNKEESLVSPKALYERFTETPKYSDLVSDIDIDNLVAEMNYVSSATIDQSKSNPTQMFSWSNDHGAANAGYPYGNVIWWIMANTHRYVGRTFGYTDNVADLGVEIAQLADTNVMNNGPIARLANGGTVDITGKDIYVKLPTFYYKGVNNGTKTTIYFAKSNIDGTYHKFDGDHTLIGAFEATSIGSGSNEVLTSRFEDDIVVEKTQAEMKEMARRRSYGDNKFSLITYEVHKVLALLFYAYYGTTNAQALVGNGVPYDEDTWASTLVAGKSMSLGMTNTTTSNYTIYGCTNLMGFENLFGHCYEFLDDLVCDGDIWYETDYDGNFKRELPLGIKNNGGPIKEMVFGDACDVTPKTVNGGASYTTYFTDSGNAIFVDGDVASRGGFADDASAGVGNLGLAWNAGDAYDDLGSRLLYRGNITIVDSL